MKLQTVLFALLVTLFSCSGPQRPTDGGVSQPTSWIATAETSVNIIAEALPIAQATVQALAMLDPAERAAIVASIQAVENQIPAARAALNEYRTNPSAANLCLARSAVSLIGMLSLNIADALGAAGLATPSLILVAVGGIASFADEFIPMCPVDAGGATMTATVASRLQALPPNLHALPNTR